MLHVCDHLMNYICSTAWNECVCYIKALLQLLLVSVSVTNDFQ